MSNSYDELSDDAPTRSRGFSLPSVRFFSLPEAITSENPYMSSIFYSFTIAALLSSCAFSMWEFYLYQQNYDNFEKDVPVWQCDAPAILKAILSSAVFNLVLVAGSIIAGFVGVGITFSNYLNKSQLLRTLRIGYLSFQIIVSLIIIILGIIVSVFLWGTYCRGDGRLRHCSSCFNSQRVLFQELTLFTMLMWLVDMGLKLFLIYVTALYHRALKRVNEKIVF